MQTALTTILHLTQGRLSHLEIIGRSEWFELCAGFVERPQRLCLPFHPGGIAGVSQPLVHAAQLKQCQALPIGIVPLEAEVNRYAEGFARFPHDGIAMGKASKQVIMDMLGITTGLTNHWIMHTMQTNIHFEEDEFNFLKARRDMGVREAIWARNRYYELLDE